MWQRKTIVNAGYGVQFTVDHFIGLTSYIALLIATFDFGWIIFIFYLLYFLSYCGKVNPMSMTIRVVLCIKANIRVIERMNASKMNHNHTILLLLTQHFCFHFIIYAERKIYYFSYSKAIKQHQKYEEKIWCVVWWCKRLSLRLSHFGFDKILKKIESTKIRITISIFTEKQNTHAHTPSTNCSSVNWRGKKRNLLSV